MSRRPLVPRARYFKCCKCLNEIRTRRAYVKHNESCAVAVNIGILLDEGQVEFMASGCWEWRAVRTGSARYGKYGGVYAHRLACEWNYRPDDIEELLALHRCDNPPCVNPSHLYWGNFFDNNSDTVARNRWNGKRGDEHWTRTKPENNPWLKRGTARHWSVKTKKDEVMP